MANLPTRQDLQAVGRRAILATPDTRISPSIIDLRGSDVNLIVGMSSVMAEQVVAALARCMKTLFADTARDSALDRVVTDRGGPPRKDENTATVFLTLSRPTSGAGAGIIPAGSRYQTPGGTQYGLDNEVSFGALALSVSNIPATCLIAGPDGNTPKGTINTVVDVGFDATITVNNNAQEASGGNPLEDDIRYLGRYRGFFQTIRRGTKQAIEQAGLNTDGVSVATASEILNDLAVPVALTQLVIGDLDGLASGTTIQATKDKLLEFRALGIPVDVLTGIQVFVPVRYNLAFQLGVDQQQKAAEVRAVTVARSRFLRGGETLFVSDLIAGAKTVQGVIVSDASVELPIGDTVPQKVQDTIRIRNEDVTFV